MTMILRRAVVATLLAAAIHGAPILGPAAAQDGYPNRQITMIVPFAPGGTSDVIARIAGEELSRILGQRIVPENVAGAGGSTALTRLSRAAPDGYTIGIGNSGTSAAVYWIHDNVTFKPTDFAGIGLIAKTAPMVALRQDFPAANMAEFLDHLRKNPGKVTLGHAGTGSSNHLICLNFIQAAKVEVQLVGYRGAAPALNDLLAKSIDGVCDGATSLQNHVLAGSAKAMAVATDGRLPTLPNVPTSAEAGLPDFSMQGWNAYFVPKGTPAPIVAKLNAALRQALNSDSVKKRLSELAASIPPEAERSPEYLDAMVPQEVERYRKLLGK
jgi:tripartite-type tricarboxylate transporter receptor subunit TctC